MIFSLRPTKKHREQQRPLYIVFIDLTKAFALVQYHLILSSTNVSEKQLTKRDGENKENKKLTVNNKIHVYQACILSIETCSMYAKKGAQARESPLKNSSGSSRKACQNGPTHPKKEGKCIQNDHGCLSPCYSVHY